MAARRMDPWHDTPLCPRPDCRGPGVTGYLDGFALAPPWLRCCACGDGFQVDGVEWARALAADKSYERSETRDCVSLRAKPRRRAATLWLAGVPREPDPREDEATLRVLAALGCPLGTAMAIATAAWLGARVRLVRDLGAVVLVERVPRQAAAFLRSAGLRETSVCGRKTWGWAR